MRMIIQIKINIRFEIIPSKKLCILGDNTNLAHVIDHVGPQNAWYVNDTDEVNKHLKNILLIYLLNINCLTSIDSVFVSIWTLDYFFTRQARFIWLMLLWMWVICPQPQAVYMSVHLSVHLSVCLCVQLASTQTKNGTNDGQSHIHIYQI